jgi:GNAT superfamily N-acetyltransferase
MGHGRRVIDEQQCDGCGTMPGVTDFDTYLASLIASWRALAVPHADAVVIDGDGFTAARFAEPVLNNAVLYRADAVAAAEQVYPPGAPYALWCLDDDPPIAAALAERGYRMTETTRPMVCSLDDVPAPPSGPGAHGPVVLLGADPERVAELNGVPDLLRGVPGVRAYATGAYESGLILLPAGSDVNVSLVATLPVARGRGLATAVTRAALLDARARGAQTASLQATPAAERLYARLGFRSVGRWHEYTPSTHVR